MQVVLVILTVLVAVFYIGRKGYTAFFQQESKCTGCALSEFGKKNEKI